MQLPPSPFAVITGAGSGFGRAIALELARRGGRLLLSDRDLASCEETARLCREAGSTSAKAMLCDVTKIEQVEALAAACDGRVDLLVNNAGVSSGGNVGELPLEVWRWTVEVNMWGVIHGCHVFVPLMKKQRSGHILNMASAAGLLSAPHMGAYNVAKAAVVALSETLAAELRDTGVDVTVLCPTFFRTNIASSGRFSDDKLKASAEHLVDHGISAQEVAKAALTSVEKGELYCVPMADGRWGWRLKRAVPGSFHAITSRWMKRRA